MIMLDVATARANIAAMLTHLDDNDETKAALRGLRVANRVSAQLSARLDVLGVAGKGRMVIIDALLGDPAGLRLCAEMFTMATIAAGGWTLAVETPAIT